ncbi:hypothetical protein [Roseomonas sp. CECT 9278]|uniref:hypothetical protein n=1 Tax=Roseomonas sp. CECT 9278 TaxID=2845823 RepID=UPI001E35AB97|nr:hypothetical protein [Roseomonas sp. CECT 9278]
MTWWSGDNSTIRMSCPACGAFSLTLTLAKPDNAIKALSCDTCNLSGYEQVQAAMDSWADRTAAAEAKDQAAHAQAAAEALPEHHANRRRKVA